MSSHVASISWKPRLVMVAHVEDVRYVMEKLVTTSAAALVAVSLAA